MAHEQAHDVAQHVAHHGGDLGVDGDRLGVGGFSAGGNLAASVCLQARDRSSFEPRFQLLGVPSLDVAQEYADKQPVGSPMLGPGILDLVRATYFRDPSRRTDPYASPLLAPNVADLPPTMIVTAELDLLRPRETPTRPASPRRGCRSSTASWPGATTTSWTAPTPARRWT